MHKLASYIIVFCTAICIYGFGPGTVHPTQKQWVIVIDPGHGGKDPGCHGKKFQEKNIALAVSLKLGHYLEDNDKNVKVVYTRTTDEFVPLNDRAEIANKNHADIFICIHLNASPDHSANGSATYVMAPRKSEGNLEVEKQENSAVLFEKDYKKTYSGFDPNSPEANIIFSMYQNLYLTQSLDFSTKIQDEYEHHEKRKDNGVKQAGFLVLWKTAMPSLLTEIGFLTNPDEEKILGSQKGQDEIANSIFLAFEQYKAEKDGTTYDASSLNMTPLVVANMPDTVEVDTIHAISVNKEEQKEEVKDSTSKKEVATHVKEALKENKTDVKPDAKVEKMQEAVKNMHTDTVASTNKFVPTIDSAAKNDSTRIVYKVQFAVSPKPLQMHDAKYAGIPQIEMYQDNANYKYTAGNYYVLSDAVELQTKMRNDGYKDAFVVTFKGNKRVTLTKLSSK